MVAVTGLAEVAENATFEQMTHQPLSGEQDDDFEIEKLDELHEIRLRCRDQRLLLPLGPDPGAGDDLCEIEIGIEPDRAPCIRVYFGALGKRY